MFAMPPEISLRPSTILVSPGNSSIHTPLPNTVDPSFLPSDYKPQTQAPAMPTTTSSSASSSSDSTPAIEVPQVPENPPSAYHQGFIGGSSIQIYPIQPSQIQKIR
jgi:hypothetical protein